MPSCRSHVKPIRKGGFFMALFRIVYDVVVKSELITRKAYVVIMTDWFKEYESHPVVEKSQIKWNFTKDFQIQSKYIVEDVSSIITRLGNAKDEELLNISQHCYNLLSWARQMDIMGFTGLEYYIDELLLDHFGDKEIILKLQKQSFTKWIKDKTGSQKIGENYFVLHDGRIYYKKLHGQWCVVKEGDVFNLSPEMSVVEDVGTIEALDADYEPSVYHQLYYEWQKGEYKYNIPDNHFSSSGGESTPEDELDKSLAKIKRIIANPVSLEVVRSLGYIDDERLEYLIKISYIMTQFVQTRRGNGEHTIYLLRDCLIFYEIHKTLDILEGVATSSDQLIAGRKLLSNKKREGGHWYFTQEALFFAYEECPDDFNGFYKAFSIILSDYEEYNDEFREFIKKLADYIDLHIPTDLSSGTTVNIVDLGFQGSINILVKYVIDKHCRAGKNHNTEIHMFVLAEWFKSIYSGMYTSETYSLLTNIEVLARNELLYDYKLGSFAESVPSVIMGFEDEQELANEELIVTTMVTSIAKNLRLI